MKDKAKPAGFGNNKVVCVEEKKKEKMCFSPFFKWKGEQCITPMVNNKMRFGLPNRRRCRCCALGKDGISSEARRGEAEGSFHASLPVPAFPDALCLVLINSVLQAPPWFSGQGRTKIPSSPVPSWLNNAKFRDAPGAEQREAECPALPPARS